MANVEVRNIYKNYDSVEAVKNLSFHVKKGEFVSLLGTSGCGKTTTLRIIAGLEQYDRGEVLIDGKDITSTPIHKRNIGFVFQNYALFPHMTVRENIEFGLKMKNISKNSDSKVRDILALVGLEGCEDRMPNQLSGGQQQRVALCRTLVLNPQVLLLDEPLSNLDAKLRKKMRIELKDIQRKIKVAAIYVTHDQEEALAMSDKIIVMNKGQSVQIGTPYEIYEKPASVFVADFMGRVNLYKGRIVKKIGSEVTIVSDQTPDIKVLLTLEEEKDCTEGKQCLFLVRKEGIEILHKEYKERTDVESFIARVQAVVYLGSHSEFICTFEGKKGQIVFRIPVSLGSLELPGIGDKVILGWRPSNITLINEKDEKGEKYE